MFAGMDALLELQVRGALAATLELARTEAVDLTTVQPDRVG
jgi:Tfp pilus assembly protein FimT